MKLENDILIRFLDQDREVPIPDLLVHISIHPAEGHPIYLKPQLTDENGCIQLIQSEVNEKISHNLEEADLFFSELPDMRKQDCLEIRVLNPQELKDDFEMKKVFSTETAQSLREMMEKCVNTAYMGRKLLCDIHEENLITLTRQI